MRSAVIISLAASIAAGCAATRGGPIPYDESGTFAAPDPLTLATLQEGYKIAPMDTVSVNVFKMEGSVLTSGVTACCALAL